MRPTITVLLVISICVIAILAIVGIFSLAQSTNLLPSNANSNQISKDLDAFTEIEVQANANVSITEADRYFIEYGNDTSSQSDQIQASVTDGKLLITSSRPGYQTLTSLQIAQPVKITVYTPHVNSIKIFSRGTVYAEDITSDDLTIEVNGSGIIELNNIKTTTMRASINGSGNILVSGTSDQLSSQVVGSGTLDGQNLKAQTASAQIVGSGTILTDVNKSLTVIIQGSGTVKYANDPEITQQLSGSGSVEHL